MKEIMLLKKIYCNDLLTKIIDWPADKNDSTGVSQEDSEEEQEVEGAGDDHQFRSPAKPIIDWMIYFGQKLIFFSSEICFLYLSIHTPATSHRNFRPTAVQLEREQF